MADEGLRKGCLWAIVVICLMPFVLVFVYIILVYFGRHGECVRLENGLNIGYEAIFDLGNPFFTPIWVPKFDDGTPLVREDMWPIYITDTTLYGVVLSTDTTPGYRMAWRADTGVVLNDENPVLYEDIISAPGLRNYGIPVDIIGTGALFLRLIKRPEFANQRCKTALLTW